MECKNQCDCCDCEMFAESEICIIRNNHFNNQRLIWNGVHCRKYGHYALSCELLKDGIGYDTDFVYENEKNRIKNTIDINRR